VTRSVIETGLLVAALLAIGGFIAYWLYPPSAGYLYHQAEVLMASKRSSDWKTARDEYIDPLDSRFPDNPYREQTQKWRDKILLDQAESRAAVISSPSRTKLNQPANITESLFVVTFDSAQAASDRGDDLRAKELWEAMAQKLKPEDPEQRLWYLHALERAKEREIVMRDRRQFVETQLDEARLARVRGRIDEANRIIRQVFEQHGHCRDLADLFQIQRQTVVAPEALPATPSGKSPQPAEEGKPTGAPSEHKSESPRAAGTSENPAPPSSPDDKPRPKPPTDEPKEQPG
jgi:serine/threonine-protein kinase